MIRKVFENSFFLVLSKPSGVSAHNESPSVTGWLTENNFSLHLVNRLDRETSGLMVVAKKSELHSEIATALDDGSKIYRALLFGKWKGPQAQTGASSATPPSITWTFPLTDRAESRTNIQGDTQDQKPCVTQASLLRTNSYFTEVELLLLSGRQHQIRRHAALFGQAVVGDDRYGNAKFNLKIHSLYPEIRHRLQLHAEKIEFSFRGQKHSFHDSEFSVDDFFKEAQSFSALPAVSK